MWAAAAAILLCIYGEVRGQEQECYICKPEVMDSELESQFPGERLPLCGLDPPLRNTCPPSFSKGCMTKKHGSHIISKLCSSLPVSQCITANDVTYCYCKGSLCNSEVTTTTTLAPETDDEDLSSEGSGEGVTQSSTTARAAPKEGDSPAVRGGAALALPSLVTLLASLLYSAL